MSEDWLAKYESEKQGSTKRESNIEYFSTSYVQIDEALGGNGLPLGKVIDISGPAGVGKSALVHDIIASYQENHAVAVLLDINRDFDSEWAQRRANVDLKRLLVFQPKGTENILAACSKLMQQGVGLIVIDSVSSINFPEGQSLKDIINPLLPNLIDFQTSIIFISQIRQDLENGGLTTPLNNSLNDLCNIRIMLKELGGIKHLEVLMGKKLEVNVYKNSLAIPKVTNIELFI